MQKGIQPSWMFVACLLLIPVMVLVGLKVGAVNLAWGDVLDVLRFDSQGYEHIVVWELRFPRILLGGLVGASLAVAGSLMQAVTRNPLASPNLTGVIGGASLAVVAALSFGYADSAMLPYLALIGGIGGAGLTFLLAWQRVISPMRLALAGVAVTAFSMAAVTALLLATGSGADDIFFWLSGGLLGRGWSHLDIIWPGAVVMICMALTGAKFLNLLTLGEEVARALGGRVWLLRLVFSLLAIFLTALTVAVAGPISFIGLVIPHVARLLVGDDQRLLLPFSALLGAMLLMLADILARIAFAPVELPVGLFTAVLGGGFFIWLIQKKVV